MDCSGSNHTKKERTIKMGITKQEGRKKYLIKRAVDVSLALVLAASALLSVKLIKKDFRSIDHQKAPDDQIISSAPETSLPDGQSIYVSKAFDNDKIHQGPLILVNSENKYDWGNDNLKSLLAVRDKDGTDCYSVLDNDVMARGSAASALNQMLKDFSEETGHEDIRIDNAYRSVAEQQSIYDNAEDTSNVSEPGGSDYHTGYSIDLNVVNEDGESLDFDGKGDYEWFEKNGHKYGFILRCPEGKENLTGQGYRPWHFRYVGKAHASYIYEKGLCLEEYLNELKLFHPYDGEHLKISDSDGNKYEVYYFAADTSAVITSVAVPGSYKYEISGNNSDGFILTVCLDIPVVNEEQASPTEATEVKPTKSE